MRSKKGNGIFLTIIIDALMIAATLLALYTIHERASDRASDWQDLYTKDSALLVDVLMASPGDVDIYYPVQPGYYSKMESNRFAIGRLRTTQIPNNPVETDYDFLAFGFATNSKVHIKESEYKETYLKFTRRGNTVALEGQTNPLQYCLDVPMQKQAFTFNVKYPSIHVSQEKHGKTQFIAEQVKDKLDLKDWLEYNDTNEDFIIEFDLHKEATSSMRLEYSDDLLMNKLSCLIKLFATQQLFQIPIQQSTTQVTNPTITIYLGNEQRLAIHTDQRAQLAQSIADAIALGTKKDE